MIERRLRILLRNTSMRILVTVLVGSQECILCEAIIIDSG
jgi:hypothetical protein